VGAQPENGAGAAGTAHVVDVTINGERVRHSVLARQLLVHFIRDTLALKGTHIGCDTGNCGACTVLVDGRLTKSCMLLAVQADGSEIETIEGLTASGRADALREAFTAEHGIQCGYCSPGMLMNARALLDRNPAPTEEEIRRHLKGNICRCTGYENIVRSVEAAARAEVAS
jgi:aerobic carbon-monoxide dehydrogenase small subunit